MGVEIVGSLPRVILGGTSAAPGDSPVWGDLAGVGLAGTVTLSASQPASDPFSDVSGAGAAVSRTFNAAAGVRHRLTALTVSYSAAPAGGRLTVTDSATTVLDLDIVASGPLVVPLPPGGIRGTVNAAMVITLAAPGGAIIGKIATAKLTG